MVNRVRTLLLNLPAAAVPGPGEEYVPATFTPAGLSGTTAAARLALFGAGADRTGINLNLARLLAFLHTSELAADVTAADARLTYDPAAPADVWDDLGPAAEPLSGSDPIVGWEGRPAFDAPGRAYGTWLVATDGGPGSVSVSPLSSGDALPLSGSRLALVVPTGSSGRWQASLLVPPAHNFVTAAAGFDGAERLFAPANSTAEARWKAVWDSDAPAPLRAAALALALAERTSDLLGGV